MSANVKVQWLVYNAAVGGCRTVCVPDSALPVISFWGCAAFVVRRLRWMMTSSKFPPGLLCSPPDVFAGMIKVVIGHVGVNPGGAWKGWECARELFGSCVNTICPPLCYPHMHG